MYPFQKSKAVIAISLLTIITGVIVIMGWIFNIPYLQTVFPGYVSMKFNTAICFSLLGGASFTTQFQSRKYSKIVFFAFSFIVLLISVASLCQDLFNFNAGIDQLFISDNAAKALNEPFAGRMAANTAVSFILFAFAFLGFISKIRLINILSQYLLHIVTAISAIAIIGYLYGLSLFYNLAYIGSMAVHTALLFLFLSITASLLHPSLGIASLFTGELPGNKIARQLIMLTTFIIIICGTLRVVLFQGNQVFSLEFVISFLTLCLLLIWYIANWLNKIDLKRNKAEEEVKAINEEVEKKMGEHSAELINLIEKIKKSEEKYHALVEQAPDAMYILDFKGNIIEVNASMCKLTGYTKEELLKFNIANLIDPEQLKTAPLTYGSLEPGKALVTERRMIGKDGRIFDVEVNVKMFSDDKLFIIARNITQRKQMETELHDAELKFRTLAEKSTAGIYIIQKENFIYVNPRFAEVFGYQPRELMSPGFNFVDLLIHEDCQAIVRKNIQARYKGEIDFACYEVKGKKKDGTINHIEFSGSRAVFEGEPTIVGTMIDISKRWEAEDILKRSEAKLQTIMDTTDTAYALFDKKLRVTAFNKMAVKFANSQYGHPPKECDKLTDYFPPERLPQFLDAANQVFKGENISYEINYEQPDGTELWYYVRMFPITGNQDEIFGLLLALSDITERKNAEDSLKIAYTRIQDHINSIKNIAWKQSHLVRSPLANLKGLVVLLQDDPSDNKILKKIQVELERMDKVIIEMAEDASNHDL